MSTGDLDETLIDEAAQWAALLGSGHASPEEFAAFAAWRDADPRRRAVFERMSGGLGALYSERLRQVPREHLLRVLDAPNSRRHLLGSALALAGIALSGALLARLQGWLPGPNSLWAGTGERLSLTLADGSHLILNARSRVQQRFDGQRRHLWLHSGELLVDVARDPTRPFIVESAQGRIRALGTRFLVRETQETTRLVMLHSQARLTLPDGTWHEVGAGRSVLFDRHGILEQGPASGHEGAWVDGQLEVRDRPLGEVIEALRVYRRGIIRVAPEAASLRLSGLYPLDDSERSLHLLEQSLPIRVIRHGPYWVSIVPL